MKIDSSFWSNRKVLITGHTGFKGSWLGMMLNQLGATVYGYALEPPTSPSLYNIANLDDIVFSKIGDIRDFEGLTKHIERIRPEIIFHLAAQPIVIDSYEKPTETFEINVMGTVNLFEAIRKEESVRAVINVTTDKVYLNQEWDWPYRENDLIGGMILTQVVRPVLN